MTHRAQLWRAEAPRILSDSDLARVLGITPGYVPKLRHRGWLPKRSKVEYTGQAGGKGIRRYRFIDAVAAEVARISSSEFGWPPKDLRRIGELIRSGDENAVRGSGFFTLRGELPGTVKVIFVPPEEMTGAIGAAITADLALPLNTPLERRQVLMATPLIDVVEAVATKLYDKMARAGIEFSGLDGPAGIKKKKRGPRRKN